MSSFVPCRVCGGDARASLACSECRGTGVRLASPDGWLVWKPVVSERVFATRHTRVFANKVTHAVLAILVVACLGAFILEVGLNHPFDALLTMEFWERGYWYATSLWLGLLLGCFLVFRLAVYSDRTRVLPNWAQVVTETSAVDPMSIDPKQIVDVSLYTSPAVWSVLESAHRLAKQLGRNEIGTAHLFAACLASPAGGIFTTRLGMDFERVRAGLATLVNRGPAGDEPILSKEVKQVLLSAYMNARNEHRRYVGVIELFLETFEADESLQHVLDAAGYTPSFVRNVAHWIRIQEQLKEEHDRFVMLARLKPNTSMNRTMTARQTSVLDRFSEDLTLAARNGFIAPVIGRDREMDELLRAIESGRKSVVVLGDSGVGKTALIEMLARRMVEERVPKELFDKRLVSVQLPQLIAAGDPAMAVERLLALLQEVGQSGNIVLVLQGIEALAGGAGTGPVDLAEALAAELRKGYLFVIGTTTPQAWTSYLERRTIASQLVQVRLPELNVEDSIRVLMAKSGFIEYQNQVFFSYAALEKAVTLSRRYLSEQRLPASALSIAKEAAIIAKRDRGEHSFVMADDVAKVVHDKTNIPVEAVSQDETEKLLRLEDRLHGRVIGQDEAVVAVAQAMRRARAEIREGKRPIANFLFLGPTGVGKTELSKALAAEYFGNAEAMIRLDMSEYQDRSAVARVIGAPGDERGGLLTSAVRKNPFSIVLLDELEKAHPDILTLFLQVMDDGRLTDGVGRTVDFTNVVLIATSNAGTSYIQEQVAAGTPLAQVKTGLMERELKGTFRPEFLNRFDGVIVFKPLSLDDVTKIAWLTIASITKRLLEKGITFKAEDAAVEELAHLGYDPMFGARPLRRVIQERVENALADLILRNAVGRRDTLVLEPGSRLRVEKAEL